MYVPFAMLIRLTRLNGLLSVLRRMFVEFRGYVVYGSPRKYLNLLTSLIQHRFKLTTAIALPHRYYVEPTNACNLRCPFCIGAQGRPSRDTGMMSTQLFDSVIDQIAPFAFWIHMYSRGEPLLHPDILHMISYAHACRIGTKISSNLNALREADVERLVRSGLDHLVVSLDGATQDSYATYRVGGRLDTVLENLRAIAAKKKELKKRTPFITAKVLVMKANENELDRIKSMAKAAGADNVVLSVMLVDVTDLEAVDKYAPSNPENAWSHIRSELTIRPGGPRACPELWHMGVVFAWNGAVLPCCYVDDEVHSLGRLSTTAFKDIWNNDQYRASRRAFREGDTCDPQTICVSCRGSIKAK